MDMLIQDDREQLRSMFDRLVSLAEKRTWVPSPPSEVELRVTSMDSPRLASFEATEAFVDYVRRHHQVELTLAGGGYGCFELAFVATGNASVRLHRALEEDPGIQGSLNALGAHIVRLKSGEAQKTYAAGFDMQIGVATNRTVGTERMTPEGIQGVFGNGFSDDVHYGLAEVSVIDLTRGQSRDGMLRRVWRAVTFGLLDARRRPRRVLLRRLDVIEEAAFRKALEVLGSHGALLTVHGYANDFDDALRSCVLGDYLIRVEQLGFVPVLFSWPSQGSPLAYTPDENRARNSQRPFLDALHVVTDVMRGKVVDLLAHSHGNMVVVSGFGEKHSKVALNPLERLVLVEPDVDQKFLEQRVDDVLAASRRVALYHSSNDRALLLAEKLFSSIRAGRSGASSASVSAAGDRLEVIDASKVAAGLSRHAPHLDSPEVIRDIHDVLEGKSASQRFGVRPLPTTGYWEMYRPR
jgi:hypothetical protein